MEKFNLSNLDELAKPRSEKALEAARLRKEARAKSPVIGQLIYRAKIHQNVWDRIIALAQNEVADQYSGLLSYIMEPANCFLTNAENGFVNVELGADSFREQEWCALHRIVSCIIDHYENTASYEVVFQSCEGLQLNRHYLNPNPFSPTKEFEDYVVENMENLTPEQTASAVCLFIPLKD